MASFKNVKYPNGNWYLRYDGPAPEAVVSPEGEIPDSAFLERSDITSLVIGDQVSRISIWSLSGLSGLKKLHIGKSADFICLRDSKDLEEITISPENDKLLLKDNVVYVNYKTSATYPYQTILACIPKALTGKFVVPAETKKIAGSGFSGASNLTELVLHKEIDDYSGSLCEDMDSLESLTLPRLYKNGDAYWPVPMLFNRSLNPIPTNEKTYSIDVTVVSNVFKDVYDNLLKMNFRRMVQETKDFYCTCPKSLREITVLGGEICPRAFAGMESLEVINLGEDVVSIAPDAFEGCKNLKVINCAATKLIGNQLIDGVLYNSAKTELFFYPPKREGECYEVAEKVIIRPFAFAYASNLKKVIIHGNRIDEKAFYGAESLEEIKGFPSSVGEQAFAYCSSLKSLTLPYSICIDGFVGPSILVGCNSIEELNLAEFCNTGNNPSTLASMFELTPDYNQPAPIPDSLKKITLSGMSVTPNAFERCYLDAEVIINANVERICSKAFHNCWLKKLSISHKIESIASDAFGWCKIKEFEVDAENPKMKCVDNAIYTKDGYDLIKVANNESVTKFHVPNGTVSVMPFAFAGCEFLQEITLPKKIFKLASCAFWDCRSLSELYIPKAVSIVQEDIFNEGCGVKTVYYENLFKPKWAKELSKRYKAKYKRGKLN